MPQVESSGADSERGVVFALGEQFLALPLGAVLRVLRAVHISPLPKAPAIVLGVINVQGEVLPVIDLRWRFSLPEKALALGDHLLLARAQGRRLALRVDSASEVIDYRPGDFVATADVAPGTPYLKGILKAESGMILIQDLDALLSPQEARAIDEAIDHA